MFDVGIDGGRVVAYLRFFCPRRQMFSRRVFLFGRAGMGQISKVRLC